MLDLTRTVRFCLTGEDAEGDAPRDNTYAAWPPMRGLGRYYELAVTCRGDADPTTGYFINIKQIDQAVRDHALPLLRSRIRDASHAVHTPMGTLQQQLLHAIQPPLQHTVTRLALQLAPTLQLAIETHDMAHIQLSQHYDFSAAHRLHVPKLTDEQNRQTFGKCNNPNGHGHNYKLRVVARCPIDPQGHTLEPATLDAAVNQHVIKPLDHKHLNQDVPAFQHRNPSVEHIAQTIWDMLQPNMPTGAALDELTVWETEKTACTYRG